MKKSEFLQGIRHGIPICLGYFSVSAAFGITAVRSGLPLWTAVLISLTNVTSAGQFAGVNLMVAGGSMIEIAMTTLIINIRYFLMSLSVSQKVESKMSMKKRLGIAYGITDEIFAVAMGYFKEVTFPYMLGLQILPILGWGGGTFAGAVASGLLPKSVCSALSLALYGMFVAIVVPVAKKSKSVLFVVCVAALFSILLYYVPIFHFISTGISIVICTVAAAAIGAIVAPVKKKGEE